MKNFIFTFAKFFTLITLLMVASIVTAAAQGTLDPGDPNSYVDPANTSPLLIGLTMLISYFSGFIPGLKKINVTWLRSIVVGIVIVAGAATFKFGFFTKETVQYIVEAFLPNFAYSGFIYEGLKALLKLVGIDLKSVKPATTPAA